MEGFRLDVLRSLPSYAAKMKYCKQMLGQPIGNGSSRMVFQIDDETVLKLAKNEKGIVQNKREYSLYRSNASPYLPKVMNGSDDEGYLWIVSEYVLPSKAKDFKEAMGIPFKHVKDFMFSMVRNNHNMMRHILSMYEDNDRAVKFLKGIEDLHSSYDAAIGDMTRLTNWGMVMRDGQPIMVLLDSGLSREIYERYYRWW